MEYNTTPVDSKPWFSGGGGGYVPGSTEPAQTVAALIEQITDALAEVRRLTGVCADRMSGAVPEKEWPENRQLTLTEQLRYIYLLARACESNARRIEVTLG